jgi:hypothetical protein
MRGLKGKVKNLKVTDNKYNAIPNAGMSNFSLNILFSISLSSARVSDFFI